MKTYPLIYLIIVLFSNSAVAHLKVIYPNVNGAGKDLFGYAALELALENSGISYDLELSSVKVNDARIRIMILEKHISISDFGTSPESEQQFLPVYFPIDLGLNGWRIFSIHKDNQPQFSSITTLKSLRQKSAGQGVGWSDTKILENAGLKVITSPHISNLFSMVEKKRFDYFPLSANATHFLINKYKDLIPNVIVESNILLIYPFGRLFFVHKDNKELHDAVKAGLVKSFKTGEFWKLFKSHKSNKGLFTKADLKNRTQILIDNPHMTKAFKQIPKEYFFDLKMLD